MPTATVCNGAATETLVYNALGQRIETSGGPSGTVLYRYDEQGHLLGEYDGSGGLIEETVWLGDIPVATLRLNGSAVAIYYVHTDQLNTPRQVTRPSDNALMWTWFSDPFGTDAANSNPSGAGMFSYNLRFPGQIFDRQVGLHSNYFRDFDPATGRYAESDPVGLLLGGINTYAYAYGNPLRYSDPRGTDVRVENGPQVGGLHQSISVDTPNGPYRISFGDTQGVLGSSQSGSSTDPVENGVGSGRGIRGSVSTNLCLGRATYDAGPRSDHREMLRQQFGKRAPYNVVTNSCRTFSQTQFDRVRDRFEGSWWQRLILHILSFGGVAY